MLNAVFCFKKDASPLDSSKPHKRAENVIVLTSETIRMLEQVCVVPLKQLNLFQRVFEKVDDDHDELITPLQVRFTHSTNTSIVRGFDLVTSIFGTIGFPSS